MKSFFRPHLFTGLLFSLVCLSFGVDRTISISGVVVDSVTGQPIEEAIVLLCDTTADPNINIEDLGNFSIDSTTTDENGAFNTTITCPRINLALIVAIVKQNYSSYIGAAALLSTTIDFDTVALVPFESASKDTLVVSGTVVDAVGRNGIEQAMVGVSGADFDTVGNTAMTDDDGFFSRQVVVCRLTVDPSIGSLIDVPSCIVGYIVSKEGYTTVTGFKIPADNAVDLDTIFLESNSQIIWKGQRLARQQTGVPGMAVYTLDGKLLYRGPVVPVNHVLRRAAGTLLLDITRGTTVVERKTIVPVR
ncbi:MAG: hypothetical protein JW768_15720 [Chitinispirillaceae bacterium]|nr:hypothetical protein [Chitinispirillaceae bacterium]